MSVNLAVALLMFALLFVLQKRGAGASGKGGFGSGKSKGVPWWVIIAFAVIGAANLAATGLGMWLADRLGDLVGLFGGASSFLAGAGMIVMIVVVAIDVGRDHKADKPAIVAVLLLVLLFIVADGPIADAGAQVTNSIASATAGGIGSLIGE